MRHPLLVLLAVSPLVACARSAPDIAIDLDAAGHDNVYTLRWETPLVAEPRIVYGEGDAYDRVAVGRSEDGLHHELELRGLAAGLEWQVQVESEGPDGLYSSEPLVIETPAAPDTLPGLEVSKAPASAGEGATVTVIRGPEVDVVALVDRLGRYVWWQDVQHIASFRAAYDPATATVSWVASPNGEHGLYRCALGGQPELVAVLPGVAHHDMRLDPAGGWYVLTYDPRTVDTDAGAQVIQGDAILHVSGDGGEIRTVWSSWDTHAYTGELFDGPQGPEFPHTNALSVDPTTGHLLVSMYMLDQVVMVDPATGAEDWALGGEDSDWAIPEKERFARQHSPLLLDDGRTLAVFDNGVEADVNDFSEASIYTLDPATRTASRTWSFGDGGAHAQVTMGSVTPLPEGGWLVSWGSDGELTEVSPAGEVQLRVAAEGDGVGYSELLPTLGG